MRPPQAPPWPEAQSGLLLDLTGAGFLVSVVLAGLVGVWALILVAAGRVELSLPLVAEALAAALAAAHGWRVRRRRSGTRSATGLAHSASVAHPLSTSRRTGAHRVVLALLGGSLAWLSLPLLLSEMPLAVPSAAGLLLVVGAGASAAAADRWALWVWLSAAIGGPMASLLTHHTEASRFVGAGLLAAGVVMLWMARRVHELVRRADRVKRENDLLVTELRNQVALVEAAHQEKTRFLAAASHDLRQPMHALGLFAAALEKELRSTPQHPKIVSMTRAVDALEDSFSAMLDVSKLDAGVVQATLQTFPIRDVFRRLHMHCAGQAEAKGLSLRLRSGGKLVTSDPQLLERILGNLVHNAIHCTVEGGVAVVVRDRKGRTSIEVWDSGVGIATDQLPKIFDEFYQVGNAGRDRSKGLGMGLAIVKRLVALLRYDMEVRSALGKGSVFRLLLPATELADMQSLVLGADTVPAEPDDDRTVLVIDDEQAIRDGMQELLESWGCTVLLAGTIAQARAVVRAHGGVIDVLISDLRLADQEDGLDAIAEVRAAYGAPLPAILITGDTSPVEVRRAHEGGHPLLFKPVHSRDLYTALRGVP